ncbi:MULTISPECIES: DNA-binding protein [unclassified Rhizobium]|uniref:DNA-binding protein n=1 Tax=unclassified Rhizobium TaxID=2613769 RepID=UPI00115CA303|nr:MULTISPECIES: DNA-binding protein [unclassified Rhizobium]TQX91829.1 DNA-binding protein [Rhizobium sp. rho-13.1]TQY18669.1 DNA-binding protein [Rhizobium sp. rho-1.1]
MFAVRRDDLQRVAQAKINDAQLLLAHRRASNAYYLAGYAVEIGLKACIAKQISAETIPELNFVRSIYDHDLQKLIRVAGLSAELKQAQDADKDFAVNWAIVCEWKPDDRYGLKDLGTAQVMIAAVMDETGGVLPWIRERW